MRVTSITVCRKDSVRIKDKWASLIGGKTLIGHKIDILKKCKNLENVVVGSNVAGIKKICELKNVEHFWRDEFFCDESRCSANEMIYDMCSKVETDIIMWAHCTNPLISQSTYDRAIEMFLKNRELGYDSLLSVDIVKEHLWSTDKKPMNYNPYEKRHVLAKDLDPLYKQNGAIFIQSKKDFLKNKYFFGKNPFLFETPNLEAVDINEMADLHLANLFLEAEGIK
jgi:CMP-N,N'-diacetyllegionaminic acid synthase